MLSNAHNIYLSILAINRQTLLHHVAAHNARTVNVAAHNDVALHNVAPHHAAVVQHSIMLQRSYRSAA
jgi:hypothetical protein